MANQIIEGLHSDLLVGRFSQSLGKFIQMGLLNKDAAVAAKHFFVHSGVDKNDGMLPNDAFGTIHEAMVQARLEAAKTGYVPNIAVIVLPGHAESITAASTTALGWYVDKPGIRFYGIGHDGSRPVISFTTATTAKVQVISTATNCVIDNFEFKAAFADVVNPVDIDANGTQFSNNVFSSAGLTNTNPDKWVTVAAGAEDVKILNNFTSDVSTGSTHIVDFGAACVRPTVVGNVFVADTATALVALADCIDATVYDNDMRNVTGSTITASGSPTYLRNETVGGSETEITSIASALYGSAGIASFPTGAVAANAVSMAEVLRITQEAITTGGTATALPANTNIYDLLAGANGIPTYPAAAAPANNVSLAEVVRRIYDDNLGNGTSTARNSLLGIKVSKTAATLPASTTQDIFTIAGGRVLVTLLTGEVTTVVEGGANNLSVVLATTVGGNVTLASTVDIDADEAGTIYGVEGDGTALVATSSGGFLKGASGGGMVLAEGTIHILTSATKTGETSWELWYIPLDDGATVASA